MVCHVENLFNWTQLVSSDSSLSVMLIGQRSRVTEGELAVTACVILL